MLKSLSAKIIAATILLIVVSSSADFLITSNINATLNTKTNALIKHMQNAIVGKDDLIESLLANNLTLAEQKLQAEQAHAITKNTLSTQMTRKFLEGTRNGIAASSLTLIKNTMMMGDAGAAQDVMDVLLENPKIFAINLWRIDGEQAFHDNKTINEVNKITGGENYQQRDVTEPVLIPRGGRFETLKKVVDRGQSGLITTGEEENDDGDLEPVEYAYYLMENGDSCMPCHGESLQPRGVFEVAVSRAALIELEKTGATQMAKAEAQHTQESAKLKQENMANSKAVKTQTEILAIEVSDGQAQVTQAQSSAQTMSITTKFAFFILTIGVLFVVLNKLLTKPIKSMTNAMKSLAGGNTTVEIPGVQSEDEIGMMAEAVQVFKVNMIKADELSAHQAVTQQEREQRTAHLERASQQFDHNISDMLETISSASSELHSTAKSMHNTADQTTNQASNVASAADLASANVQTVASAAEELSSSISEISRQVNHSTNIAGNAVVEVEGANQKVQSLANAAKKIGEVVALITDIADQTNLLALNATIEAARAGDAGKGFAVVASEVKNLANQTAKATEEISSQIGNIQGATHEAVSAIESIGTIINEINEITSGIAAAVEEQGSATQEIARNVEQAANGTQEVSSNISSVTQAASETGESSNEVLSASEELNKQAESLRSEVDSFLRDIKSS